MPILPEEVQSPTRPRRNGGLYRAVAGFLAIICLISTLSICVLAFMQKETPSALLAIATGSLGALTGFMARPPTSDG